MENTTTLVKGKETVKETVTEFKINSVIGNISETKLMGNITEVSQKKRDKLNSDLNIGFDKRITVKETDTVKVNTKVLTNNSKSVNSITVSYDSPTILKKITELYGFDFVKMFNSCIGDFDKQKLVNLYKKVAVSLE
jgi:hypothetical protein